MIENYTQVLKRAGYLYISDRRSGKTSYVRSLARANYPRFHMYVKDEPGLVLFDLHLDHKQASYEGNHMHNAEYEGDLVESEMGRLAGLAGRNAILGEMAERAMPKPMPNAYQPKTPEAHGKYAGRPLVLGHGSLDDFNRPATPVKPKKKWWQIF